MSATLSLRAACAIVAVACWHGWALLGRRVDDASGATLVALVAALAWRLRRDARVPVTTVAAWLSACAGAAATGVALVEIGAGVAALVALCWPERRLAALALAGLALPVLPTLDFLLAWPLRRVASVIAVALLRLNGVDVVLEGVALDWHGERLLFDGPCSGVRMLWAALVLASLVAAVRGLSPPRHAALLAAAVAAAVVGNALRAASLFYLENGFVAGFGGPVAHEAVGVLAFAMLAALMLAGVRRERVA